VLVEVKSRLAAFAQIGGAGLILNEICPNRREILRELFPGVPLSAHDAEQIDDCVIFGLCSKLFD
jgi:hypothetical protein